MSFRAELTNNPETKPGVYTTEFWLIVVMNAFAVFQQAAGLFHVADKYVLLSQFALNGIYAVSRGVAKLGQTHYPSAPPDMEPEPVDEGEVPAPEGRPRGLVEGSE